MARNESKSKGLYYRTPEQVMFTLAYYLRLSSYVEARFLDPCAGKGLALAELTKTLKKRYDAELLPHQVPKITMYGIEPNQGRAYKAQKRLDMCLTASFFDAVVDNAAFSCILLNPPYDFDTEAFRPNGKQQRLEVSFLRRATMKLAPGGTLIYIVPQKVLKDAAPILSTYYTDFTFFRFPDTEWDIREPDDKETKEPVMQSMYGQFSQVVLICRKPPFQSGVTDPRLVQQLEEWSQMGADAPVLPLLDSHMGESEKPSHTYLLPGANRELDNFLSRAFSPSEVAQKLSIPVGRDYPTQGVWANASYQNLHWPSAITRKMSIGHPVAPLKLAHQSILAVAGIVNGAILESEDGSQKLIVKGYTRKESKVTVDEDEEAITKTKSDIHRSALFALDPATGELYYIPIGKVANLPMKLDYQIMSMEDFLKNFGKSLTTEIARTNPSLYVGEWQVPWSSQAFKQLKLPPMRAQKRFILAQTHFLMNYSRRSGEIAEMATGKTYMSLAIAHLADLWCSGLTHLFPKQYIGKKTNKRLVKPPHFFPAIALVPEIITYKWKRESERIIPGVKAVIIQRIDTLSKAEELRKFDPTFTGKELSAIGCADRVIARMKFELDEWKASCAQAKREGKPIPRKPAHIAIVNSGTAKFDTEWEPRYLLRPLKVPDETGQLKMVRQSETDMPLLVPVCPDCGSAIRDNLLVQRKMRQDKNYKRKMQVQDQMRKKQGKILPLQKDDTLADHGDDIDDLGLYASESLLLGKGGDPNKFACSECGTPLWSDVRSKGKWKSFSPFQLFKEMPHEKEKRVLSLPGGDRPIFPITSTVKQRFPVADYIRRKYKDFFQILIADEIHQGNEGTAISLARESLIQATQRAVGLTGTLCNGKASSLAPLLRMINPEFMELFGYDGTEEFVRQFGVQQETQKFYKENTQVSYSTGVTTKQRRSEGTIVKKEVAGFSALGLRFVLGCCTFLELSEVAPHLPKLREYVHIVPMSEPLKSAYADFEREITQDLRRLLVLGNKSALASWFQSLLAYPNMPYNGWTCMIKKTGYVLGTAPKLDESIIQAKEQELIQIVESNFKLNRRVLIYAEHTGEYDIMPRLQSIITRMVRNDSGRVPKVICMPSSKPKPIDREAWLLKQVEEGCDVLICNPATVQVGLDLIDFPTIVFYELPTSTSKLRQSSRRHHRPGQTKPCEVHYLSYPTMEMRMLYLMARKTEVSMTIEGQLGDGEGLMSLQSDDDDDGENMKMALARQIMTAMENGGLEQSPEELATELQSVFNQNEQLAVEMAQAIIGVSEDGEVDLESDDVFTTEEVGTVVEEATQAIETRKPVVLEPVSSHKLKSIETPEGMTTSTTDESVVVVPISRLTDTWELLRLKVKEMSSKKKGGKRKAAEKAQASLVPAGGDLWSQPVVEGPPEEDVAPMKLW